MKRKNIFISAVTASVILMCSGIAQTDVFAGTTKAGIETECDTTLNNVFSTANLGSNDIGYGVISAVAEKIDIYDDTTGQYIYSVTEDFPLAFRMYFNKYQNGESGDLHSLYIGANVYRIEPAGGGTTDDTKWFFPDDMKDANNQSTADQKKGALQKIVKNYTSVECAYNKFTIGNEGNMTSLDDAENGILTWGDIVSLQEPDSKPRVYFMPYTEYRDKYAYYTLSMTVEELVGKPGDKLKVTVHQYYSPDAPGSTWVFNSVPYLTLGGGGTNRNVVLNNGAVVQSGYIYIPYEVSYDINGGTGTTPTVPTGEYFTCDHNKVTTSDGTGLTKDDAKILGWSKTKVDHVITDQGEIPDDMVAPGEEYTITENTILYAVWADESISTVKAVPIVTGVVVSSPPEVLDTTDINDIVLSYTAAVPAGGTIKLDDGQTIKAGMHTYNWTYTPAQEDADKYDVATGRILINAKETYQVNVNVAEDQSELGSVSGGGRCKREESVSVTATAKEGCIFAGWYDGNTKVSDDATYSFEPTGDITLTARFARMISAVNVAVSAPVKGAESQKSITETDGYTGVITWTPDESPFASNKEYSAKVELSAKPGYVFTSEATVQVSEAESVKDISVAADGSSLSFTAGFEKTDRTLTGIEITAQPVKTYAHGAKLDKSGMVVKAKYDEGEAEEISDYTIRYANGDYLKKGDTSVTISYGDKEAKITDLTVNPKELTVTGLAATNRTYDGTDSVDLTGGELQGVVDGETVTADMPVSGTMSDANVGTQKTVTFEAITLTGDDADNYTLTQPVVNVDIAKATPTADMFDITAPEEKTYDGTEATVTAPTLKSRYSGVGKITVKYNGSTKAPVNVGDYEATFDVEEGENFNAATGLSIGTLKIKNAVHNVTGVTLDKTTEEIIEGNSVKLTPTVSPTNATNKAVTWSSSNTGVATVDANGNVKAVKPGTATITVKTKDGNKTATCKVTVKAKTVAVTGVKLNETTATVTVGSALKLTPTVSPVNATNKAVTWSSSNTGVATVDANGNVKAVKPGTATITVKTKDGTKTATCKVTVKAKTVAVTGVKLNETTATVTVGSALKLTPTVSPANATNKAVTWSSSNTGVATVDANGNVKAVKPGTATITAKTKDGSKTAKCTVTVKAKTTPVKVKNGWYNEGGFKYYKNGNAYIGWHKMGKAEGEKIEHWSYFGKDGKIYTGWKKMGENEGEKTEHLSYFGDNGWLRTGWQQMGKGTNNPDGNTEKHISYFGDNGWLRTGWQQMGKGTNNPDGNAEKHISYFGDNGWLRTGWQQMGKGTNNPYGNAEKHISYFGDNGWLRTGWQQMGKGTNNPDGNTEKHISYFGSNGWLRTGMVTLGKADGEEVTHKSYFGENGWLVTNKKFSVAGKTYYADARGWLK